MLLHWQLLQELKRLRNPATPLDQKLDLLSWVLTEPAYDAHPFSFATCVRVVGLSPWSPASYLGVVDVDVIRHWIRREARQWLADGLVGCPDWVVQQVLAHPSWAERQLERDPRWLARCSIAPHPQEDLFVKSLV